MTTSTHSHKVWTDEGGHVIRSVRTGLMAVAHDISRMLGWVGIRAVETE